MSPAFVQPTAFVQPFVHRVFVTSTAVQAKPELKDREVQVQTKNGLEFKDQAVQTEDDWNLIRKKDTFKSRCHFCRRKGHSVLQCIARQKAQELARSKPNNCVTHCSTSTPEQDLASTTIGLAPDVIQEKPDLRTVIQQRRQEKDSYLSDQDEEDVNMVFHVSKEDRQGLEDFYQDPQDYELDYEL